MQQGDNNFLLLESCLTVFYYYFYSSSILFLDSNIYKSRIMKTRQKQGYISVCLFKDDIRRDFKVHRLVAESFISNPNNLPFINHIDENKLNNKAENLEWCSREYNNNYGQRNGKISLTQKKNKLLKMVNEQAISLDGNKYISIPILQELIEDVYNFYG